MKTSFELYNQITNQLSNNEIKELICKLEKHLRRETINKKINDWNENINIGLNASLGKDEEEGTLIDIRYKK